MTDTRVINAIIYLRLSDLRLTDLKDGETIEDYLKKREDKLRALAEHLSTETVRWEVIKVVRENDAIAKVSKSGKMCMASAYKRRTVTLSDGSKVKRVVRPGFSGILDDFKNGVANGLLAEDLDRVVRDTRDLDDFVDIVKDHKVNARSLSGSLTLTDGGTDGEIMTATVLVAVAKKSSADTARRVADGRERKALDGKYGGGIRPFGWEVDGITKRDAEWDLIRPMTVRVLQKISLVRQPHSVMFDALSVVVASAGSGLVLTAPV